MSFEEVYCLMKSKGQNRLHSDGQRGHVAGGVLEPRLLGTTLELSPISVLGSLVLFCTPRPAPPCPAQGENPATRRLSHRREGVQDYRREGGTGGEGETT